MRSGILLFLFSCLCGPLAAQAQAPSTLEPPPEGPAAAVAEVLPDFPARHTAPYQRPDLSVPLVIAADCGMDEAETAGLLRDLALLVRNFPDDPRITHRLRARAIAFALSLRPDYRDCVVANGQLARGITPAPLTVDAPLTAGMLAARLHARSTQLLQKGSAGPLRCGKLTLALAAALNWDYAPALAAAVPPDEDLWLEKLPAVVVPPGPVHSIHLEQASVRIMMPSLDILGIQLIPSRLSTRKDAGEFRVVLAEGVPDNDPRWRYARTWLGRRYPDWPSGCLAVVQYPGALPPAVGGLLRAVLADRYLAGAATHPEMVLACGISEEGNIISTTDPVAALEAAISHRGTPVRLVLAAEDEEVLLNWLVADRSRWEKFCRVTVLTAGSLQDVIGLTERRHAALLTRALEKFDALNLNPPSAARMRAPEVLQGLEEVTGLHPRHLSASMLLRIARGNLPKQFTMARSLELLEALHWIAMEGRAERPASDLTPSLFGKTLDDLAKNRPTLQPALLPWAREITEMARLRDRYLFRPPTDSAGRDAMRAALQKQRSHTEKSRTEAYRKAELPLPARGNGGAQ